MPVIRDRQIKTMYAQLEAQRRTNPGLTIDDAQVTKLLGAVADSSRLSGSKALSELNKPGITRAQQVELIKQGMTATEKADLATILDNGSVPLSESAKNFLEAVLDRTPVKPGNPLQIVVSGDQKNGITGIAGANVTIEAINLSTAPGARLHNDDTMVIGKTDQFGKFSGKLPDMQEGDLIRMRARDANGNVGEWVEIKAKGIGTRDTRGAVLAAFRLGLSDAGNGKINVTNINGSRQISEPGAKVQFKNLRTGEKSVVTIDSEGQLPKNLVLNGRAGDPFEIAASDGINNTNFTVAAATVQVPGGTSNNTTIDLPDPALHKDELDASGKPKFSSKRYSGPLFTDGVKPTDVAQGQIGNCYMPAAYAAMAQSNPDALAKMIKDNGDGTYTVTFKEKDWRNNRYRDVEVKVDGDLYVRAWGGPLYGSVTSSDKGPTTMEMWYPLVEKAYAQWKGSYNSIGNGGLADDVMEATLGRPGVNRSIKYTNPEQLWGEITKAIDEKRPAAAGTYGESQSALYTNSGVYANHAYSILGYEEKNGEKLLIIRNPWGESEPAGNGANDGIFKMKLEEFTRLYQSFMTVQ